MTRVLIAVILVAWSLCTGLSSGDANRPQGGPMVVTVLFKGLMIFSYPGLGPKTCDVGILPEADHSLEVLCDGISVEDLSISPLDVWTLSVPGSTQGIDHQGALDPVDRKKDEPNKQYDFGWIINLEKLHPGSAINGKALSPRIHLVNGTLFSETKTEYMMRLKNRVKEMPEFGFLTESVGLSVEVNPGQTFRLWNDTKQRVICEVPYDVGPRHHILTIQNLRFRNRSPKSDFHFYYKAFKNPAPRDHFDFELWDDPNKPKPSPHNPAPKHLIAADTSPTTRGKPGKNMQKGEMEKRTCCGYDCNPTGTGTPIFP